MDTHKHTELLESANYCDTHRLTITHKVTELDTEKRTFIDEKVDFERKRERVMRIVNLTKNCICGHTPTPKQTSVSKLHKSPHFSSSV